MLPTDLKLITKADAAEAFSVSVKTIDNYIKDGNLPPPTLFVSKEYWHPQDFRDFLDRKFKQCPVATEVVAQLTDNEPPPAPPGAAQVTSPEKAVGEGKKDSSPLVRQQARQKRLLSRLNAR